MYLIDRWVWTEGADAQLERVSNLPKDTQLVSGWPWLETKHDDLQPPFCCSVLMVCVCVCVCLSVYIYLCTNTYAHIKE